jgi:hypothetical protein
MLDRKQSTATYPVLFFMADSTDHITGKTGLSPTVTIAKNGGTFAAPATTTVTAVGNGWYAWTGAAGDWNTVGEMAIHAAASGADPADLKYTVIPSDPFSATDLGLSSIATILAQANKLTFDGSNNVAAILAAAARVKLDASQPDYAPAKAGNQMTLTSAYDACKTAAQAGTKMDLIDSPNATAILAIRGYGSNLLLTQNVFVNAMSAYINHGDTYWKTSDGVRTTSFAAAAAGDISDIEAAIAGIPAATYSGPSAADIQAQLEGTGSYLKLIKTKTDLLTFTGSDLKATLDGETVVLGATQNLYAPSKAGDAMTLTGAYDRAKTAATAAEVAAVTTGLETYGDIHWHTATGFSTFDPATTAVTLAATQSLYAPAKAGDQMALTSGTLTSIRTGLALTSELDLVKAVTDHLATMIVLDGAAYIYTSPALANAPTGTGGGGDGGEYTGPTAIEIRQEIDANSTQLAEIISDLGALDALSAISGRTTDILGGITILMSMVEQAGDSWRFNDAAIYNIANFVVSYGNQYWFTGPSSVHCLYTLTSTLDNSPIPDARVRFTSDEAGENTVVTEWTDDQGMAAFDLNAGHYWLWRDKPDWIFENPQPITIGGND